MGGAIGTDDAGTVEHKCDGELLDTDVVDQLVVGPLQEGAVDRHDRAQPLTGHTGGQGHRMLFGDAHIHVLGGDRLLQEIKPGPRGHGRRDPHHATVLLAELDQGLAKHLAVAGWLRSLRGNRLAGAQVEGRLGVIAHLIGFGVGIPLALLGDHMNQHRAAVAMGGLEGPHHRADVVAVDGAHVGEAQFLEHRADLRHSQATHAALEAIQLIRQLPSHEGEIFHALLNTSRQELHRRAQTGPVQGIRQGAHRR